MYGTKPSLHTCHQWLLDEINERFSALSPYGSYCCQHVGDEMNSISWCTITYPVGPGQRFEGCLFQRLSKLLEFKDVDVAISSADRWWESGTMIPQVVRKILWTWVVTSCWVDTWYCSASGSTLSTGLHWHCTTFSQCCTLVCTWTFEKSGHASKAQIWCSGSRSASCSKSATWYVTITRL